jgi:hypothetical protein
MNLIKASDAYELSIAGYKNKEHSIDITDIIRHAEQLIQQSSASGKLNCNLLRSEFQCEITLEKTRKYIESCGYFTHRFGVSKSAGLNINWGRPK